MMRLTIYMNDAGFDSGARAESPKAELRRQQRSVVIENIPKHARQTVLNLVPSDSPRTYIGSQADFAPSEFQRVFATLQQTLDPYTEKLGPGYRNIYPDIFGLATTATNAAELTNGVGFIAGLGDALKGNNLVNHQLQDFFGSHDRVRAHFEPSDQARQILRAIGDRWRASDNPDLKDIYEAFFSPNSPDFQKNAPYLLEAYFYVILYPRSDERKINRLKELFVHDAAKLGFGQKSDAIRQMCGPNASYWAHVDGRQVNEKIDVKQKSWKERQQEEEDKAWEEAWNGFPGWGRQAGGNQHNSEQNSQGNGQSKQQEQTRTDNNQQTEETSEQLAARLLGVTPGLIPSLSLDARQAVQKFASTLALAVHPDKIANLPPEMKAQAEQLALGTVHVINEMRGK